MTLITAELPTTPLATGDALELEGVAGGERRCGKLGSDQGHGVFVMLSRTAGLWPAS